MNRWQERSLRATAVLLVTSAVLILPGLAGLRGSVVLAIVFAVIAGLLFVGRGRLATRPVVADSEVGPFLTDLWVAPLLSALAIAVVSGASPGELQALGGLAGLAGMANYFLRPAYRFGLSLVLPRER